jgi:hypothetical protein
MNPRTQSQLDTPKEWILDGRMFRIKSWEIKKEEIDVLIKSIVKGPYKLNQIHDKNGELKGITLLFLSSEEDVELIRTTILITSSGTELRKTSHILTPTIETKTIKTTAPLWVTKAKLYNIFSKYNSDPNTYDISVDQKMMVGIKYPIIRFHPTHVDRNGRKTKVNVAYVEFSPVPEYSKDSFIALSMEHRCVFKNIISDEEAVLIFDKWMVENKKEKVELTPVGLPDGLPVGLPVQLSI